MSGRTTFVPVRTKRSSSGDRSGPASDDHPSPASITPVPLGVVLLLFALLRWAAWAVDPLHRWWRPVSLLQGRAYLFTGELMIAVILLASVRLWRRMVAGNEWEDVFVLSLAVFAHAQMLTPWGRSGPLHDLCALSAFVAYAWLLLQTGYRNRSWPLLAGGGVMVCLAVAGEVALQRSSLYWFGILEHLLIVGLLIGFWLYDHVHVTSAIRREASPRTCRYNNFKPPYL